MATLIGYWAVFIILVVIAVLRAKKGKSYRIIYIVSVVLAVLATIGAFAQRAAGGQFDMEDALEIVGSLVIELIGLIALLVIKKRRAANAAEMQEENML